MKKKKLNKQEQLVQDWREYNKRFKDKRLKVTFEQYQDIVFGKRKRIKVKPETSTVNPVWAKPANEAPSLITNTQTTFGRATKVEMVLQGKIYGKDAEGIMNKANRIGLSTSKGSYQYISDETDLKTLGKKTQALDN